MDFFFFSFRGDVAAGLRRLGLCGCVGEMAVGLECVSCHAEQVISQNGTLRAASWGVSWTRHLTTYPDGHYSLVEERVDQLDYLGTCPV